MSDKLNEFQKIAIRSYWGGEYRHLDTMPDDNLLDTLLLFVLRELVDVEDVDEVVRRMNAAMYDIAVVRDALVEELEKGAA